MTDSVAFPIVSVRGLVKRYADTTAVDGVSFDIAEGSIFGLLGPNGAGKTTAISMIACLIAPDDGDVLVDGHSVRTDATGWAMIALKDTVARGMGVEAVLLPVGVLLGMAALFFVVGIARLRLE